MEKNSITFSKTNEKYYEEFLKYFREKNLYQLNKDMIKHIVLNLPENPIESLIKFIQEYDLKSKLKIVIGTVRINGASISGDFCSEPSYNYFDVDATTQVSIDSLKERIKESKENFLLIGYPRNIKEAMELIRAGLMPERIVFIRQNNDIKDEFIANDCDYMNEEESELERYLAKNIIYINAKTSMYGMKNSLLTLFSPKGEELNVKMVVLAEQKCISDKSLELLCEKYNLRLIDIHKIFDQNKYLNKGMINLEYRQNYRVVDFLTNFKATLAKSLERVDALGRGWIVRGMPQNQLLLSYIKAKISHIFVSNEPEKYNSYWNEFLMNLVLNDVNDLGNFYPNKVYSIEEGKELEFDQIDEIISKK